MPIKLDASAVIYFTKATLLKLVKTLYGELFITEAVYQEMVVQGKAAGHRDAAEVERMISEAKMQVIGLNESAEARLRDAALPDSLGRGEKETIIEAAEQGCLAVLDDLRARATAAALGVTLCRSDTLLVEGLLKGHITQSEFQAMAISLAGVKGMRADDLIELLRLGRLIKEVLENDNQDVRGES